MTKVAIEFIFIFVAYQLLFASGCAITKVSVRVDDVQVEVEVRP